MAGTLQPLGNQFPIVNPDGTPTTYFIRWAQQRQIDIGDSVPSSRKINTGKGLSGGGDLSADRTIVLDASLSDLNDVDFSTLPATGEVLEFNGTKWVPAVGGGGGGGTAAWKVDGAGTGTSQSFTLPSTGLTLPSVLVFVNGIRWETTEYTISGTTLTLTTNSSGDLVEIIGVLGSSGGSGGGGSSDLIAFAVFSSNGTGVAPTILSQKNISAIRDDGGGCFNVTFSTPVPSPWYMVDVNGKFGGYSNDATPGAGGLNRNTSGRNQWDVNGCDILGPGGGPQYYMFRAMYPS